MAASHSPSEGAEHIIIIIIIIHITLFWQHHRHEAAKHVGSDAV
jgi:hypothetical protein